MVLNEFLFLDVSDATLATKGNMPTGQQKGFVRIVNFNVAASQEPSGALASDQR
jgi:hypothetical protein